MDEIFFRLVNSGFLELPGLRVDASIPVSEYLINEVLEAALRGNRNITECRVSIQEENQVTVHLKTPLWPWPLHLKMKLKRSVDFNGSPRVSAELENNLFLGKLGAVFHALPEGIHLKGKQVIVDLQALVSAPEQKRLLNLVKWAEIHTEEARVIFDVKVKVENGAH